MGLVHPGIPKELALQLQRQYGIETFVETGTYYGGTAVWASSHFKDVFTIEFAKPIYDQVVKTHGSLSNVHFIFGNSREELPKITAALDKPTLFWLDGHWSVGETYGENDECPILDEIGAILQSPFAHFILIDDARLFLAPPPEPLHIEQWPTIKTIVDHFSSTAHRYEVFVYEDAIIAVPQSAAQFTAEYLQDKTSEAWGTYLSPTRRGYGLVREGGHLMYRGMLTKIRRLIPNPIVRGIKSVLKPTS